MFQIPGCIEYLRTGAQDFLGRSQRAWEAACKAWNEVPEEPAPEISVRMPKIVISDRKEAIRHAQRATDDFSNDLRLVLWTDASGGRRLGAGWAAVFREGSTWVRITARGPREADSNIAELQAIGLALDYAIQVTERNTGNGKDQLQILELYTDSQGALNCLRKAFLNSSVLDTDRIVATCARGRKAQMTTMMARDVGLKITQLQQAGVDIQLHWVPRNTITGNILADKGAGLARIGVECHYKRNNALIEFLPTRSVVRGRVKDWNGTLLNRSYKTVPQMRMAEEIATTLRERAAEEEEMLAAMAQHAAEQQAIEAARKIPTEAEIEAQEAIWQDGVQKMAQVSNTVTDDEMVEVTGEETTEAVGQTAEVGDILYDDPLPIDPQLYLSFPEDMVGVSTGEVVAAEEEATQALGECTAPAPETEEPAVMQHDMMFRIKPRVLYLTQDLVPCRAEY